MARPRSTTRTAAATATPTAASLIEKELRNYDALARTEIDARKALAASKAELQRLSGKTKDAALCLEILKRTDANAMVGQPKCSPDAVAIAARQAAKAK